jgi:hypothetical protein
VEAAVERLVRGNRCNSGGAIRQKSIDLVEDRQHRGELVLRLQAFGGHTGRGPFEDAAGFDDVENILYGEGSGDESAALADLKETLMLETFEHEPERSSGDTEPGSEVDFADALAGRKLAAN